MDTLFFLASKLAGALLRPEIWIIVLVFGTWLSLVRGRQRGAAWMSGLAAGLILLTGLVPLGGLLLGPLETRYPVNPPLDDVAGILVLGGGESAELSEAWGQPQVNAAGDRFIAALGLAHRFPQAAVLFTGGIGALRQDGPAGADIAEELFLSIGLSPDRLHFERTSRTTAENARNSLPLRPPNEAGAWVLVTSAFHMPRAVETFCAAGWHDLVPWPTDFRTPGVRDGPRWGGLENLELLNLALKERVGLLAYRMTDRARGAGLEACLWTAE